MHSRAISDLPPSIVPYPSPEGVEPFPGTTAETTFRNPLLPAPAQDPHLLWHDGHYYYCESSPAGIFLRRAESFVDLASARPRLIWAPPSHGPMARNLWAPELHRIDGRFYVYFAADDGRNANHRMWVLAGPTSDPVGPYALANRLETEHWAIDGTVLEGGGERYFVWSGWPGRRNGQQNLYLARMRSPVELEPRRILLTTPDEPWERKGLPICEGPQVLRRGNRTFIVYSASGSWTEDYCLGMLIHAGGEIANPSAWRKAGPIFSKNEHALGVGHCTFVTTPDEREDWIVYHAKTSRRHGWADREIRAQRFSWSAMGEPVLGEPVAPARLQSRPNLGLPALRRSA